MYAAPVVVAAPRRSGLAAGGPILAICCLLFILFLVAATIILALIPVYVQRTNGQRRTLSSANTAVMTPTNVNGKRQMQTSLTEGTPDTPTNGGIGAAIERALRIMTGSCDIIQCRHTAQTSKRKRRGFGALRERRQSNNIKTYCPFNFNLAKCSHCGNKGYVNSIKPFFITVPVTYLENSSGSTIVLTSVTYSVIIVFTQFMFPPFTPITSGSGSGSGSVTSKLTG